MDQTGQLLKKAKGTTQNDINQIQNHLKTLNSQTQNLEPTDQQLLYGRLQYQVQKLQNDFEYQTRNMSKNIDQICNENKVNTLPQLQRPKSNQLENKKQQIMKYRPTKSFQKSSHLERNYSVKMMMQQSQSYINKEQPQQSKTASQAFKQKRFASQSLLKPYDTAQSNQQQQSSKKNKPFNCKTLKNPGKIGKPNILPAEIRKNPFADLPPINDKDLNKGVLNLQYAGQISKDMDVLPAFQQGNPILETQPKQINNSQDRFQNNYFFQEITDKYKFDNTNNFPLVKQEEDQNNFFITSAEQQQQGELIRKQIQLEQQKIKEEKKIIPIDQLDLTITLELQIINGVLKENTQNYIEMKARYSHIWGSIKGVIRKLEQFLVQHKVKMAYIDGKKVAEIADDLFKIKESDLLSCFMNQEVMKLVVQPDSNVKNNKGRLWAAMKIFCSFKMKKAIKHLQQMKQDKKAEQLKKNKVTFWLSFLISQLTIKKNITKKMERYKQVTENFKQNWNTIKHEPRVEIHVNSLAFDYFKRSTMEVFSQRENLQLSRIFRLKDPNVEIIYVAPFPLPREIVSYYYKICELGELQNYKERIHFLYPENYDKFPETFPTCKLLYYSPFTLNKIKELIQDKTAYIVPGYPTKEDSLLGYTLNIPVFCGDYQQHQKYSKKSFAKQIFQECGFPVAPGVEEIKDYDDLFNKLTLLISTWPAVKTWVFKVDNEVFGRGTAYFSLESIRALNNIFKEQTQNITEEQKFKNIEKIREIVINLLPSKLKMAHTNLFLNYKEYIEYFLNNNGIIEALPAAKEDSIQSPSLFFRIEPDGNSQIVSTYDRISGNEFVNFGCMFPQTSLPFLNIKQVVKLIGDNLYSKGIFGYISVDMIAFQGQDQKGQHSLFQMIDINCYLNTYSSSFFIFDFLTRGKLDKLYGRYYLKDMDQSQLSRQGLNEDDDYEQDSNNEDTEERTYLYAPFLYHEGLKQLNYRDFFQACRKNQISYDLEKRQGSVFLLTDQLSMGILSLLTIHESTKKALKSMTDSLNFMLQVAGHTSRLVDAYDYLNTDTFYLMDFVNKIRTLNKQYEKQQPQQIQYLQNRSQIQQQQSQQFQQQQIQYQQQQQDLD